MEVLPYSFPDSPFHNLAGVFETVGEGYCTLCFTGHKCIGFEITAIRTMIRIRIYL